MTENNPRITRKRVLVVDDSDTAATVVTDLLCELGYESRAFGSAEPALEAWEAGEFDAVVTDLRLPGMSGLELLRKIKADDEEAIVILLTEHREIDVDAELKQYDLVYYFLKPANIFEIGAVLKNAFESKVLRRDIDSLRALAISLKSIGNVKKIDEELKIVLSLAIDSLDATRGYLLRRDAEGAPVMQVGVDYQGKALAEGDVGIHACAEEVFRRESSRIWTRGQDGGEGYGEDLGSCLAVPLVVARKLEGVLVLDRRRKFAPFTEKDLVIAKIFATTLALAMENFQLFTEAKRSYRELLEAQKQLIHLEKLASLGQLTAGIAHEIKNPLTVITGLLGLLRRRLEDERQIRDVDMSLRNCNRINQIITNLRNLYTPSRGSFGPVDLNGVLEEALSLATMRSDYRDIRLVREYHPRSPMVSGDESQILQVFINLINNAIQAMAGGGELSVATLVEGAYAQVLIRDTGKGIPAEVLEHLFDPFFTTKAPGKGTGLGLSISQTIVRNHGGQIDVSSDPGEGAVFTVRLPILIGTRKKAAADTASPGRPPRVLVLDDDEDILYWLKTLLEEASVEVVTVNTAQEALDVLGEESFDLMFLDSKMPGRDGIDLYRESLSVDFPELKVVLFTGSEDLSAEAVRKVGFYALLEKPSSGDDLLALVRKARGELSTP